MYVTNSYSLDVTYSRCDVIILSCLHLCQLTEQMMDPQSKSFLILLLKPEPAAEINWGDLIYLSANQGTVFCHWTNKRPSLISDTGIRL